MSAQDSETSKASNVTPPATKLETQGPPEEVHPQSSSVAAPAISAEHSRQAAGPQAEAASAQASRTQPGAEAAAPQATRNPIFETLDGEEAQGAPAQAAPKMSLASFLWGR